MEDYCLYRTVLLLHLHEIPVKTVDSHVTTRGQDNRLFTCNNMICMSVAFLDRLFLLLNVKICTGYHRSKTD